MHYYHSWFSLLRGYSVVIHVFRGGTRERFYIQSLLRLERLLHVPTFDMFHDRIPKDSNIRLSYAIVVTAIDDICLLFVRSFVWCCISLSLFIGCLESPVGIIIAWLLFLCFIRQCIESVLNRDGSKGQRSISCWLSTLYRFKTFFLASLFVMQSPLDFLESSFNSLFYGKEIRSNRFRNNRSLERLAGNYFSRISVLNFIH